MGTALQLGKLKKFWRRMVGRSHNNASVMDLMSLDRMLKNDKDGEICVVCILPQLRTKPTLTKPGSKQR